MTRCFVIGHPIAHSRSPLIHGFWIAQYGLQGSYERIDIAPAALPGFVARLRAGESAGGNVTVPHKAAVLSLIDHVGDTARAMGAVNTLWCEDGAVHGDNTDATGFLAHLDASVPGWDSRVGTALVIGAGGAARAIAYGVGSRRVGEVLLVNRSLDRAQALAAELGRSVVAHDWRLRDDLVAKADLIVNTTALGMKGQPPLELDLRALREGTIVDDIVYVPLRTPLLTDAKARGAVTVDGLGMLLHQAVPGFARWFGVTPEVTPTLRAILEADILEA